MEAKKKKNLWIAAIIMVCFLGISIQMSAQGPDRQQKTPEERAKMMTDKMKEKLQLNDAQYKSVYDINLKYAKKNQELADKSKKDRQEQMDKFKTSQTAKDGELKNVLNSDQYTKYQEQKEKMKQNAKERGKHKGQGQKSSQSVNG